MKRILSYAVYSLISISGILQFFIIPGLFWNVAFPYLQIILVLISLKSCKSNQYIKYCTFLIIIVFSIEIGLSFHSNLNTKSIKTGKEISVMSYNLFFKNNRPYQSITVIKNENPDIIFVQELTPKLNSEIDKALGNSYPFKLTKPLSGTYGIGIYSKYKIVNQRFLYNGTNKPYAQIVDLIIHDKTIQLINTHLASPAIAVENKSRFVSLFAKNYQIRKNQIIEINKIATTENKKYDCQLLVGDLNTIQSEPIFKRLRFKWTNSTNSLYRWMNFNFPYSSKIKPIVTLDYIMGRGKINIKESKVIEGGSSDHLAIKCKLQI